MAQILNKDSISKSINKVVETQEGFILNGHFYDKKTMTPQPLEVMPLCGHATDMSLSKRISKGVNNANHGSSGTSSHNSLVVKDTYDSEVSYVFSESARTQGSVPQIARIREKDGVGQCEYIKNLNNIGNMNTGSYTRVIEYVSQNADNIFMLVDVILLANGSTSTYGTYNYLVAINKTTLSMTGIYLAARYLIGRCVLDTPQYSYLMFCGVANAITGVRLDKTTNTTSALTMSTFAGTSNTYRQGTAAPGIALADDKYLVYTIGESGGVMTFHKRIIDTNDVSLTTCANVDEAEIGYTVAGGLGISAIPALANNMRNRYCLEVSYANGKTYLNVLAYDESGTLTAGVGQYGVYTLLVDDSTHELELVGYYIVPGEVCYGMITNHKNTGIIALTSNSLRYLQFNASSQAWEEVYVESRNISSAGFDLDNNIWFEDASGNVEMVSPQTPVSISLTMDNPSYQYDGVDIATNVNVTAANFNGDKVACKVRLSAKGGIIFADTSTKTTTVDVPDGSSIAVPIIIKDGGQIIIYPELLI